MKRPLATLVLLGAAACRPDIPAPVMRLDARLARHLRVDVGPSSAGTPVWQRDGLTMSVDDASGWEGLRQLNGTLKMVMVTIPAESPLAAELADDARVLAFLPSPDGATAHALVPGGDPMMLAAIAGAAHAAAGHACGNLERMNFRALTETDSVTAAIYSETVRLPSVAALATAPVDANIGATIKTLEDMGTRYHDSTSGKAAPAAIKSLFETAAAGKIPGLAVTLVDHEGTAQQSVVVRIPGTEDAATTVAIGAHLDSINKGGPTLAAPGADDDASGIATLVEIVRAIGASGATFRRTVELHGYAAEEVGLVGSQELAASYRDQGKEVAAVLQIDMNSWSADGAETIYLVTNDTSATLRRSLKDLMNTYMGGGFQEMSLAAGTSDHRSWTREGFQAVFPFENPRDYNEALHSTSDTSATINNLALSARFATLGLVFLGHHAGLAAGAGEYDAALVAQTVSDDLKLAITDMEGSTDKQVAVAAANNVARVELCLAADGGDGCKGERVLTNTDRSSAERAFFLGETGMALSAGGRLAVFGYDNTDKLVAQRTVRLETP